MARSAAGSATGITSPIGVYSMYQLFSHTNTTGSRHTAARLTASWNAPMLVVPSPKKHAVTCPVRRIMAAQASPQAIGRCAPTIA